MAKEIQCDDCNALCCRYFALPLETPEDRGDYDDIRWFLCHRDISVFVEKGDWYISIKNKCKYLSEDDNRCMIYKKRPRICRYYSRRSCDLVEGEYDYELHFTNDKEMEEHIEMKFGDAAQERAGAKKMVSK